MTSNSFITLNKLSVLLQGNPNLVSRIHFMVLIHINILIFLLICQQILSVYTSLQIYIDLSSYYAKINVNKLKLV